MEFCRYFSFFNGIFPTSNSKLITNNSQQPSSNLQASKWTTFPNWKLYIITIFVLFPRYCKIRDSRFSICCKYFWKHPLSLCTTQQQPSSNLQARKASKSECKNTQRECVFCRKLRLSESNWIYSKLPSISNFMSGANNKRRFTTEWSK